MNWFVTQDISGKSIAEKQKMFDEDSGCEHVDKDMSKATTAYLEKDTWGTVSSHVVCETCRIAAEEAEKNELCTCDDCKKEVKRKDGRNWKWYDFYAAQGDTPYFICNECAVKPTHIARVRRDDAAREEEFPNGF